MFFFWLFFFVFCFFFVFFGFAEFPASILVALIGSHYSSTWLQMRSRPLLRIANPLSNGRAGHCCGVQTHSQTDGPAIAVECKWGPSFIAPQSSLEANRAPSRLHQGSLGVLCSWLFDLGSCFCFDFLLRDIVPGACSLLFVIGSSSLSSFLVLDSLFFSTWVLWYWFFVLGSLFLVFRSSSSISILGSWVFSLFLVVVLCSVLAYSADMV